MKIKQINLLPYKLDLKHGFKNSQIIYKKKHGYIIQIFSENFIGLGEASPLEGFSKESLQELVWGFESFKEALNLNEDYSKNELLALIKIHCYQLPSLQFGFETALYDVVSRKSNCSIAQLFNTNYNSRIKLSTIFFNNNYRDLKPYNIIKYKLGIQPIHKDIQILNKICSTLKHVVKFRFDANQLYSINEFVEICYRLKNFNVDFFEEPIKNPNLNKLKKLKSLLNIPIAIDESIYNNNNYLNWIKNQLIDTLVIKPSLFGGYQDFLELYKIAKAYKLRFIVSSALESSIGNMATIQLSSILEDGLTHGINIHAFFDKFQCQPIYKKTDAIIDLQNIIGLGLEHTND